MFLTFKWTILTTDALIFCFKINLIAMTDRSVKLKSLFRPWTLCTGWICKWFSIALRFRWRLRYIWVKKLKTIIIKFYKMMKAPRAPRLVKKQSFIATINPWTIEVYVIKVTDRTFHRFISEVKVSRCWETIQKKNQLPLARNYKLFSCSHNITHGLSRQ